MHTPTVHLNYLEEYNDAVTKFHYNFNDTICIVHIPEREIEKLVQTDNGIYDVCKDHSRPY